MIVLSVLFWAIGLALLVGGGWLVSLGGSLYYVIAGVAFIAVALLLKKRSKVANFFIRFVVNRYLDLVDYGVRFKLVAACNAYGAFLSSRYSALAHGVF